MKEKLQLYIDGSYRPKTKKGAYGVLAVTGDIKNLIASEIVNDTTNNIMEMTAMQKALELIVKYELDVHYDVEIFCDSEYVLKGLLEWSPGWATRGFKTAAGHPIKNKELWMELIDLRPQVKVSFTWIKGHGTNRHEHTQLHNEVDKIVFNLTA